MERNNPRRNYAARDRATAGDSIQSAVFGAGIGNSIAASRSPYDDEWKDYYLRQVTLADVLMGDLALGAKLP